MYMYMYNIYHNDNTCNEVYILCFELEIIQCRAEMNTKFIQIFIYVYGIQMQKLLFRRFIDT